jgi:hypothetical protein
MKHGLLAVALVLAACGGDKDKDVKDEPAAATADEAAAGPGAEASGAADLKLAQPAGGGAADPAAGAAVDPAGGAAAEPAAGGLPAGWVRFELAEDNMAIGMPKQPGAPEVFDVPTEAGTSQGKLWMVMAEPWYYGLGVVTMPQAVLDMPEPMGPDVVKAAFDEGRDQMLAAVNGKRTGERDVEVLGLPAREVDYTVSVQGQRIEGLSRMIADPETKKIYQLQVLSDRPVAAKAREFFDTFEILSKK